MSGSAVQRRISSGAVGIRRTWLPRVRQLLLIAVELARARVARAVRPWWSPPQPHVQESVARASGRAVRARAEPKMQPPGRAAARAALPNSGSADVPPVPVLLRATAKAGPLAAAGTVAHVSLPPAAELAPGAAAAGVPDLLAAWLAPVISKTDAMAESGVGGAGRPDSV